MEKGKVVIPMLNSICMFMWAAAEAEISRKKKDNFLKKRKIFFLSLFSPPPHLPLQKASLGTHSQKTFSKMEEGYLEEGEEEEEAATGFFHPFLFFWGTEGGGGSCAVYMGANLLRSSASASTSYKGEVGASLSRVKASNLAKKN